MCSIDSNDIKRSLYEKNGFSCNVYHYSKVMGYLSILIIFHFFDWIDLFDNRNHINKLDLIRRISLVVMDRNR